ncbi:alpha/beta hydrolase [Aliiroseovarius sp. 2305UL8-7]|uniref:alpha/beta hydrolase n=1 Tax=Aliiroseovarius conchicola TaxID=3121637 RepID=UPI003529C795
MKRVLRVAMGVAAIAAAAFVIGPYEPVDLAASFDDSAVTLDPDTYLKTREAVFDDLVPTAEKRIVWARASGAKTPVSIVYMHGFSANAEEIRPVPDQVAEGLGANLYFARLAGHGRSPEAMAGPTVNDWMIDMAEAMAVGRAIGDQVILISTSTGGTIAALGALDADISRGLKGVTFISPNFAIKNPASVLLTFPAARHWVPLLTGATRGFEPLNDAQAANWTENYPTAALFPMAAIVKAARQADYSSLTVPALFIYSPQDQVVDAAKTTEVAARWGGPVTTSQFQASDAVEPSAHVIAGDIVSPAGTAPTVATILDWARGL